jgi:hypothetical protein
MPREYQEPTTNEHGEESHPAFAKMRVNRIQTSPGASLFDSEITHQHYVKVTVEAATRERNLNRDWIHGGKQLIEFDMSEAQWAQVVSSFGSEGTPVTLSWTREDGMVPGIPFAPRLAISEKETASAAATAFAEISEAFEAVEEKPTKANIRRLRAAIDNAPKNVQFAARSLTEHVENVVSKAKADVEAMVHRASENAGVEAPEVRHPFELEAGEGSDE